MPAGQLALQPFEMIAGRDTKVLVGHRVVNHLELAKHPQLF